MTPRFNAHILVSLRKARFAFTLVEILVVIVIIGVLAAILLPVVSKTKQKAYASEDQQNLKQIGTALSLYMGEHNQQIPHNPVYDTPPDNSGTWNWYNEVDKYFPRGTSYPATSKYAFQLRERSPFLSHSIKPYPSWTAQAAYPALTGPLAFGYNPNIDNASNWGGRMTVVPRLSQTVIMGEMNTVAASSMDPTIAPTYDNNVQSKYRLSREGKKAFYLMGDWHVESMNEVSSKITNPKEANVWKWW